MKRGRRTNNDPTAPKSLSAPGNLLDLVSHYPDPLRITDLLLPIWIIIELMPGHKYQGCGQRCTTIEGTNILLPNEGEEAGETKVLGKQISSILHVYIITSRLTSFGARGECVTQMPEPHEHIIGLPRATSK
jgi:hypothetical protein